MRYKTLFRVLVKVIGVWFLAQGVSNLITQTFAVVQAYVRDPNYLGTSWLEYMPIYPASSILVGLYLYLGGRWIADVAIPGNRPYCPQCGYDLASTAAGECPECGLAGAADGPGRQ